MLLLRAIARKPQRAIEIVVTFVTAAQPKPPPAVHAPMRNGKQRPSEASQTAQEFHRRRAEVEIEKALAAGEISVSLLRLELAKIHRQRRDQLMAECRSSLRAQPSAIFRTDKEG